MNEELVGFATQMQSWHEKKVNRLRDIQEQIKEGTRVDLEGSPKKIELSGRDAMLMRLGMEAVLIELGELPFKISKNTDSDDAEEDDIG